MKKIINLFLNSLKVRQFLKEIAMSSILPKYCEQNFISALALQVNLCQKLFFFASTNPQYYDRLFIELQKFNTWKFQAQNMGRTCCVQKLFLKFRTISVHNMFYLCSEKRRAPDKDLPVKNRLNKKRPLCKYRQTDWEIFSKFCGLLRRYEL